MLRHADTYIRQILMTLLPHKALTTLKRFQKPKFAYRRERSKIFLLTSAFFQRLHLSTLKRHKTMKRMGSASVTKPSFLQILMKTIIFKKVMKRLIFGRNAKESAANLWRFTNPNLTSMKCDFELLRQIHPWRSYGSNLLLYKQISDRRTCNYTFQPSLINSAAIILRKFSEYLQSCLAVSNFRVTFQKEKACSIIFFTLLIWSTT